MASRRLHMTLADYVVIAFSPALIMLLVGSLVFFLLQVAYRGEFVARINWIMFCFVAAAVLIARIAIEEGAEKASLYGALLAVVVALAMLRFLDSPVVAWVLMGIVWWCAHKLTWDCTLIDDTQDASGRGLLDIAGLDGETVDEAAPDERRSGKRKRDQPPSALDDLADDPLAADQPSGPQRPTLKSWFRSLFADPETNRGRPHAPGLWVVYFSLAALPLFGLGQALIPAGDTARRLTAFWLLFWYVAAALGLLLTTSFLGLRRYLRQRKLKMPVAMTSAWLGVGAALILALLLAATLLPRPSPEYSAADSVQGMLGSPVRSASNYAVMKDSPAEGEGRPGSKGGDEEEPEAVSGPGAVDQEPTSPDQAGKGEESQAGEQAERPRDGEPQDQSSAGDGSENQSASSEQGTQQPADDQSEGQGQAQPQGQRQGQQQGQGEGQQQGQGQGQQQGQRERGQGQQQGQREGQQQGQGQQSTQPTSQSQGEQSSASDSSGSEPSQTDPEEETEEEKEKSRNQNEGGPASRQGSRTDEAASTPPSNPPAANKPWQLPDVGKWVPSAWLRWLVYAVLAVAAVYAFIKYHDRVIPFLRRLWQELLELLNGLSGGGKPTTAAPAAAAGTTVPRPFSAFSNPFASGAVQRASPAQLVRYTFEAVEAWSFERGIGRRPDETPLEFARMLAVTYPELAGDVRELAELYVQITYARARLANDCLPTLQRIWQQLTHAATPVEN